MSDYESTAGLPLFDGSAKPMTRASHPETSKLAAQSLIDSGRLGSDEADALELVRKFPGHTAYELQDMDTSSREDRIRKRLGGLRNKGLVYHGDKKLCTVKGSLCVTWFPKWREEQG